MIAPRAGLDRLEFLWNQLVARGEVWGDYDVRFEDGSQIHVVFSALANVLPGQHVIVFAPASWPQDELGALDERTVRRRPVPLSAREREILTLIADGLSLAEIAERLTISLATVRTHTGNAYRKLGARNRPHAVAWHCGGADRARRCPARETPGRPRDPGRPRRYEGTRSSPASSI